MYFRMCQSYLETQYIAIGMQNGLVLSIIIHYCDSALYKMHCAQHYPTLTPDMEYEASLPFINFNLPKGLFYSIHLLDE